MQQLVRAAEAGLIELDHPIAPTEATSVAAEEPPPKLAPDGPPHRRESPIEAPEEPAVTGPAKDGPPEIDGTETSAGEPAPAPPSGETATTPDTRETTGPEEATASGSPQSTDQPVPARPLQTCYDAASLELPRLAASEAWTERIRDLRAALIGEFDKPDQEIARKLARTYLATGLTEEARAVVADFGDAGQPGVVLAEIAAVVAGRTLADDAAVLRSDCLGPQALWRALERANAGNGQEAMVALKAAGRALEKLPAGLRQDVSARLGLAATVAGEWDTARQLLALVDRSGRDHPLSAGWSHLLAARIAHSKGDEAEAIRALTRARGADPEVAAEATLMLGDIAVRAGRGKRAGLNRLIVDLGLLARLHRGTTIGARAADLEVRLTHRRDGPAKAVDLLTLGLALGQFTEATFTATLSAISAGGQAGDRDSIAAIYLDDPEIFRPALEDPDFRAILAGSLIRLGLPAQAANLYTPGQVPAGLAIELAEGFLAVGDRRSAISLIADLPESPERDRLHRAAMAGSGNDVPGHAAGGSDPALDSRQLVALARSAVAEGDLARALDLTLERLKRDQTARVAETAAMIALALGKSEIPAAASAVLEQRDPDLHGGLARLFAEPPAPLDPDDPTTAAAFLKRLDAEIAVIEDMLDDG